MPTEDLTMRQKEVLNFIRKMIQERGYAPTVREIADRFGIVSPNGVVCHLNALVTKGYINREEHRSRSIQLTELSKTPCGLPWIDLEDVESLFEPGFMAQRIDVGSLYDPADESYFILQVNDKTLIGANVEKKDFLVFQKQSTAHKGQVVIAKLDNGNSVLRVWMPAPGRGKGGRLELPGTKQKPIHGEPNILAVAVGLFRQF